MPDILFKCPQCSKHLAVDAVGMGQTLNCTDCAHPIALLHPTVAYRCSNCTAYLCSPSSLAGETFDCPNCESQIVVPPKSTHFFNLHASGHRHGMAAHATFVHGARHERDAARRV